jgi:hypothetical protein
MSTNRADAEKLVKVTFGLRNAENKLNNAFERAKGVVDNSVFEMQKGGDIMVQKILEHLVLSDNAEFFSLLEASKEMQDEWLCNLRKTLGLDKKTERESEMAKSRETKIPSAEDIFKKFESERLGPKTESITKTSPNLAIQDTPQIERHEPDRPVIEQALMDKCIATKVAAGMPFSQAQEECRTELQDRFVHGPAIMKTGKLEEEFQKKLKERKHWLETEGNSK